MTDPGALVLERILPAPPEDVFAAWTTPAAMADWMSPVGRAEVEVDLRVGGAFRVVMVGEGASIEHTGTYLEVEPPRRLSFTWVSPYTGPDPSVVTVELHGHGEGTRLVLRHERLPADVVESHRGGWGSMLERLHAVLGPRDARP
jgi:uncharacterized protein YndB with AHSA1/START domain